MTVLIVDDDRDLSSLYKSLLEMEGHTAHLAHSGQDGIDYIEKNGSPKLVLVDYSMAGMSGDEFLSELESKGLREKNSAIVGFSSFSKDTPHIRSFQSKVTAYREKPDTVDDFLDLLKEYGIGATNS